MYEHEYMCVNKNVSSGYHVYSALPNPIAKLVLD